MFSVVVYACDGFSVVLLGSRRFSVVLVDSQWFSVVLSRRFTYGSCRISMVLSGSQRT